MAHGTVSRRCVVAEAPEASVVVAIEIRKNIDVDLLTALGAAVTTSRRRLAKARTGGHHPNRQLGTSARHRYPRFSNANMPAPGHGQAWRSLPRQDLPLDGSKVTCRQVRQFHAGRTNRQMHWRSQYPLILARLTCLTVGVACAHTW